jgi:hypothetical protein
MFQARRSSGGSWRAVECRRVAEIPLRRRRGSTRAPDTFPFYFLLSTLSRSGPMVITRVKVFQIFLVTKIQPTAYVSLGWFFALYLARNILL